MPNHKYFIIIVILLITFSKFRSYSQVFTEQESYSIILLIDVSGSMAGDKIKAAQKGGEEILSMYSKYDTEYSIITYSGSCSSPIRSHIGFSKDTIYLKEFLQTLETSNSTPLSEAYKYAAHYMKTSSRSKTQKLIFILGDGGDDCRSLDKVLEDLSTKDMLYQTVSAGLEADTKTQRDLQKIAIRTGGVYTDANPASKLELDIPKTFLIPMIKVITGYSKPASENIFYGEYPKETLIEYFNNTVFKLDSLNYLIHPDNYWGMKITIKDVPYIFNFSKDGFTYYIPESKSWVDGELRIKDDEIIITAILEDNIESNYRCRVKYLSQKRMELCLINYEGEDYCCKPNLSTEDSAFILYFTRLK
ncbi:MAG TPA: VWA domain-containing protein [Bacteroidales bacterium]|nr:VWA domain-containing protein [Bacteroidales bacterium]